MAALVYLFVDKVHVVAVGFLTVAVEPVCVTVC